MKELHAILIKILNDDLFKFLIVFMDKSHYSQG